MTAVERFMAKVAVSEDGCWLWQGGLSTNGYGRFHLSPNTTVQAHRFSYETNVGPIPEGFDVHHRCNTPLCVRPDHLVPATHAANVSLGSRATAERCPNGHLYSDANTLIQPNGRRSCRACRADRVRKFRAS